MTTRITMDEWLAALKEPEVEGYTTEELAEALGYSESHFRCRLRSKMIKSGVLRIAGRRRQGKSACQILYELQLPQKRDTTVLNVGMAVSSRDRRGVSRLPDMVAQLTQPAKKKR